ncbi:MAG: hypothetical protein K8F52_15630 [Candidatus Scalindua rubra]|uniref:RAMP superfamily protein n=1 Tax=Candidatus Scalindua brodae TaxID=237368 RepID=UPI002240E46D|nr:Chain A, RAMP superfamily protein [Candidatus Scalindua brodae]7X8A_A Chain A, RAMP superfamily protein [Candidatus Scalindua brodae]7XSO_A Chain A, RAMP superfamily protein [Candidatus Scalindua brodae]7XSP_B Chain B, RAMP superfamily protein [Candidatus Scalindua brodae]7XSQ_A Chain A, RAMP superfamily protein [Candidatus Scalindua brodae]7XSR_B Chain B, RAMP superfamily protein [Candidatus Scalindua brodae]7XSS_B Chain B, RAMP superfamily protein [Candidatus Scalindua brodae]7XT4_B Cha
MKSNDMNITVELTFFEPYRLVEWFDWDARKKSHSAMRGQAFAQWTWKGKGRTAGKSFITGTLVRSAVIKAVEELLSLNNGKWEGVPCCNGSFQTDESKGKKPSFLRKRHTLQWQANNKNICDKEEACPFCILLGRFDNAGKVHERNKDYDIHFSNFDLDHKQEKNDLRLVDIASGRILNRVDFDTGKAKDYFRTWEADYETYGTYTGRITLRNEHAKKLLLASLGFVDKLCGALCRIEVIKKSESPLPSDTKEQSYTKDDTVEVLSEDHNDELRKQAEVIVEAFKQNDKLEKIRILADAIRTLRLHGEGVIEKDELPDGKEERDKGHHLWDIKVQGTALRTKLKELWQSNKDIGWRKFTEMLGSNLYLIYKKETGGVSTRFRILGDTEYYSKAHDSEGSDLFIPVTPPEGIETKEWIIVGRLKAATPFYFGVQQPSDSIPGKEKKSEDSLVINEHTSFNILLDKENRYRIPRSALRGALRRDLRTAFGSGCNVSLGGQILCNCKVCIEMRRITLKDSVSDFSEPPEIRYRIAKNPGTATVEDGSLFDIEVGPEGLTFPFVLRYRGHKFPEQLSSVIRYWEENDGKNGMAWLGGLDSTGKGRFALKDIKIFEWDLNQKINEYIKERGMRGKEKELLEMGESSLPDGLIPYKFFEERECLFPYKENLKPQWSEVQYTIEVGSPLLTADTISALTEPGNRDAIAYKKRVYNDGNNAIEPEPRFAVKSETHRGIFRTAVGRRTGDLGKEDHEDCTCDMCIIFGNEHESSKIRFEDLELINGNEFEKLEKHIDHVAIDRFTGGALDKAKFDTYPLAGSPKKPLKLKGRFWIKKGFSGDHKLLITTALSDIRDGLYPLGSKGGVGYGWVAGISIDDNVPDDFKEMINKTEMPLPEEVEESNNGPINNDYVHPGHQSPKQDHKNKNIYYPHYFLDSGSKVYREKDIITHEEFTEELLSGKINCKLETLTPLIIPDTSDENGLKLQGNKPGHKNYKFFNINGELMIPGSELRGMLRTHFEALTKSCFAIFGEDSTLSWRMNADEKDYKIDSNSIRKMESQRNPKYRIPDELQKELRNSGNGLFNRLYTSERRFWSDVSNKFENSIDYKREILRCAGRPKNYKGGIIRQRKDSLMAEELKVHRLPLYDNFDIPDSAYKANDHCRKSATCSTSRGCRERFTCGIKVRDKNRVFLNAANNNRQYLNNIKKSNHDLYLQYLKGEKKIRFNSKVITGSERSPIDVIAELNERGRQTGFIKLSGLNNSNKSQGNTGTTFNSGWDRFELNILLDDLETRPSKSDYPRPRLLFTKDQYEYNITKRCERVFEIDKGNKTGYPVDDQIKKNYEDILDSYDGIKDQEVAERFDTFTRGSKLKVGDLVYFHIDGDNKIDSLIPVRISRKCASKTLGGKLDKALHPCTGLSDGLCPGCHLFGTTDYKGRVKFGFAKYENGPEWLITRGNNPERSLTLGVLESPRPAFSIPDDESEIPGRKFYLHHNGWRIIRQKQLEIRETVQPERNVTTEVMDKGNVFSFDVRFENLREWELGLLLQSLDPGKNIAHKLGKGKPYGFGSVKIKIDSLHTFKINSNNDKIKRVPQSDIREYINKGYQKLIEWSGNNSIQKGNVLPQWHVIPHIDKLYKLLWVPFLNDSKLEPDVRYPVLNEESKGYIEGSDYTYKKLGDKDNLPYKTRVKGLTTPWSPWNPFQVIAEHEEQEVNVTGSRPSVTDKIERDGKMV